jgi:radical SAM protein with 4Fe4S-binding SPASM domain
MEYHKTSKYKPIINYNPITKTLMNRGGILDNKGAVMIRTVDKCFVQRISPVILSNGDFILCCNDYFGKYSFGNIIKERIIDIWNKPAYRIIRKDLSKGIFNLDICKKCVGQ